ncbi:hypothetical protein GIB67_009893 [Kingdonia uniflora]|uniref:Uncharacterized protein n=1 Tax=Kingdonia uniflora TaxID=39325 RepID=A0A7J7L811_9MAGN|nr:hypothetical protein GIB67_009893 [Kingdonia uniflora]
MDDRVIPRREPSSFVIHRELHHRIGALLPNQGQRSDVCTTIHLQPRCSSSYPPEKKPTFKKRCTKNY